MTAANTASAVTPFGIGAGLSVREVHELRDRLLAAVEAGPVVLDAGAVERVDSAGLQLIISLGRSLAARGETLAYSAVSPTLTDVARTLGLAAACALPDPTGVGHGD